jgi:hypothetical protein
MTALFEIMMGRLGPGFCLGFGAHICDERVRVRYEYEYDCRGTEVNGSNGTSDRLGKSGRVIGPL